MSPASAPRPAHQPVLWLTAGADQTEAALPAVGHLLDHGHRVTLACPAEAWAELVADGQPTQEADADAHPEPETFRELATRGLRVLHPTPVDSGDARSLLHSLHRDDEAPTFEDTLRRDPRLARAAEESLVVWPGSARPTHLDGVDVATGAGGWDAVAGLMRERVDAGDATPQQVLALAEDLPQAVTPRRRVDAASTLVRQDLWTSGGARLQRHMEALASRDLAGDDLVAMAGLAFHRGLHADLLRSPLVEDPDAWLAPLRSAAAWESLTAEHDRRPVTARPEAAAAGGSHPHVVVLPGSYGRFEGAVVQTLRDAGCTVDVMDLTELAPFLKRRLVRADNLESARALIQDGEHGLPAEALQRLAAADVIWAEWADLPAVWASHLAEGHQRLVLRIHSLDTLDPWLHMVRWASVDALVAVGSPVARVALAALGNRLDLPPVHVIGHTLDEHWFDVEPTEDAHRRLVMVKWGRRVKDPLMAVEILARLREHDPSWTLRLIGDDLVQTGEKGPYATRFARRIARGDVRDALEFVPQTGDVAAHLAGCGFVLSTSRRESFHLGLVEGAAAGCVPVVRNWPVFAQQGGARDVMPSGWVVPDEDPVEGAVRRILRYADRADWEAESARVREQVRQHFPTEESLHRMACVALDREVGPR